jgi:chlorobactene glucosyltransferase
MLLAILIGAVFQSLLTLGLVFLNLAVIRKLSRSGGGAAREQVASPSVSIVVPARDEERGIEVGVGSLLAQEYPDLEVLVVNDRSSDRTGEILRSLAADPRLRIVAGREPPPGWLGKPHALFLGAQEARGSLLLFVDADVRYDPRTLAEAVEFLERERVDLLALVPRLEAAGFWEKVLLPFLAGSIFGGLGFLAIRDRPWWLAVGGGAGNLIRRSAYEAIGGHEALRDSIVDDVHLAMIAKRAGFRARFVRAEDRVGVRMYHGFREVFDGFTKNIAYCFTGLLGGALFVLWALLSLFWIVPPVVLLFAAFGGSVPAAAVSLAALAFGLVVIARLLLASELSDPLWPALTHPIMAAVWAGILCRSLYWKLVKREVVWRGRRYDAANARF